MLLVTSQGKATIPADANTGQACRRVIAVGSSEVVGYSTRVGAGARARVFSAAADISRAGSRAFKQVKLQVLLAFGRFLK